MVGHCLCCCVSVEQEWGYVEVGLVRRGGG